MGETPRERAERLAREARASQEDRDKELDRLAHKMLQDVHDADVQRQAQEEARRTKKETDKEKADRDTKRSGRFRRRR